MTMRHTVMGLAAAMVLGTAACSGGVSEEDFQDEFPTKACEALLDCLGDTTGTLALFDDQEDCESFYSLIFSLGTAGCEYDPIAGEECLDSIGSASCDDVAEDSIDACDEVYFGDSCAWATTTTITTN